MGSVLIELLGSSSRCVWARLWPLTQRLLLMLANTCSQVFDLQVPTDLLKGPIAAREAALDMIKLSEPDDFDSLANAILKGSSPPATRQGAQDRDRVALQRSGEKGDDQGVREQGHRPPPDGQEVRHASRVLQLLGVSRGLMPEARRRVADVQELVTSMMSSISPEPSTNVSADAYYAKVSKQLGFCMRCKQKR